MSRYSIIHLRKCTAAVAIVFGATLCKMLRWTRLLCVFMDMSLALVFFVVVLFLFFVCVCLSRDGIFVCFSIFYLKTGNVFVQAYGTFGSCKCLP